MRVVHEQHERPLLCARGEQAERRSPDRKAIPRARRAERERAPERGRLRLRDPVQRAQRRTEQLGQARERDHRLGLDPASSQYSHLARDLGRVFEEGSLSDAWLADERQHAATAVPRLRKQAIERQPLVGAAKQHQPILTSRHS